MSNSSSDGVKWLENVSGQHNSRSMPIIVGVVLLILAATSALFITMVVYRRFRLRRSDVEANWVFVSSEKRRTFLSRPNFEAKEKDFDDNPNWVPFRPPPPLAAVPQVHLRSPPAPRPFLRSLLLSAKHIPEQKTSPQSEHQVRRVPPPTIDTPKPEPEAETKADSESIKSVQSDSESDSETKPTIEVDVTLPTLRVTKSRSPRSPPRLTVKVPPAANFTPSIISNTPSPRTVKFFPGPPSSATNWRSEARGRWNRATQVLRSPLLPRSRAGTTPVTTSFLDSKKHKSRPKSKAARKAEEDSEFWSAGASEVRATEKLDALISQLRHEYSTDL